MKTYAFTLVLADLAELSDGQASALFDAGCDDATPISREGRVMLHFARAADSLEHAIRSATADVAQSGLRAARVEMECPV